MARVKGGVTTRARKKKIFKLTKGFWGKKKNCYRFATEAVDRAGNFAYRDRKTKKRLFRQMWIIRISAILKENGLSYSKFMGNMKKAKIEINRKMLSDIAATDPNSFLKVIEAAKTA
ncbi:MAG: 50S ribosomal protein L20 [Candidatus Firestonebacteria bacterium RIFOXYA2_FULL_40_8]|nr:MAG: 50S ribosomal protein L20 [Candidatus Firestonebacteria bacterium RIFOXYA2_FULL_40_8]